MFPSDVRRSDLVNKHIKRSISIFVELIQLVRLKLKFKFIGFNSICLNSNQDSCIQRCVVITIYSFLESDVLLKYDHHKFGVRRDRSFISQYFSDLDKLIFHNFDDPDDSSTTILVTSTNLSSTVGFWRKTQVETICCRSIQHDTSFVSALLIRLF